MGANDQAMVQEALPAYQVGEELGRGAFGIVYQARHERLGRQVAVKQLGRAFASDPTVRSRFVSEAQMVASLDHPHIVPVYDFVDREDGMCLIIMEQCSGSVGDRFTGSGLETDAACAAILACCAALDFAHGAGVLHRDIKPENLLYDSKGVVKLGDFGIARALDTDARRTATGTVIGTPAYMSPEQVRGEDLTPASDIYSVGIMAYELLSGRFPFAEFSSATGLLAHHLVTPPTPLIEARAELPGPIGEVVDRSLAKDVGERQATALELATELTKACVSAFGTGWLRRGNFVLHWPEVIAESERQTAGASLTGTIVVKADESRTLLAGHRGPDLGHSDPSVAPPAAGQPLNSGGVQYAPPTASTAPPPQAFSSGGGPAQGSQAAPPPQPFSSGGGPAQGSQAAPPPQPFTSGGGPAQGPQAAPPPQPFTSGGGPAPQPMAAPPPQAATRPVTGHGPAPIGGPYSSGPQGFVGQSGQPPSGVSGSARSGGTSRVLLVVLGFVGVLVLAVIALAIIGLAAGDGDDPDDDAGTTTTSDSGSTGSGTDSTDTSTDLGSTDFTLPITPVPETAAELIVDSPFTPTPCPAGVERAACLIAVAMDPDSGEMIAAYEVFGFNPELEPIDYHLHFYLDSSVEGDERKAGTEVSGGSWRAWDGILPFTSTGGENGRIGFTQDDVVAAGARHLCLIVADPEQRAVPGTGNCAPIPYVWDDNVALEQVDRLQGVYAGRCAIGATVIMPEGWQWLDFQANTPADAARILRPNNTAEVTPIYQDFVDSGGIMLGDGPVDGDYIVNFTVWRVEGNFTAVDSPSEVEDELGRAGLFFDNPPTTRVLAGRELNTQILQGDGFEFTQYVVPDFGYALVLDFFSPDAARWNETSDAVAATLMGC